MNICVKKFRQNSWRTAIDQRYISAIDMFLRKDCENITVSDQDLKILNSINLDYFDLVILYKIVIIVLIHNHKSFLFFSPFNLINQAKNGAIWRF